MCTTISRTHLIVTSVLLLVTLLIIGGAHVQANNAAQIIPTYPLEVYNGINHTGTQCY